jgi:hypothetical protein
MSSTSGAAASVGLAGQKRSRSPSAERGGGRSDGTSSSDASRDSSDDDDSSSSSSGNDRRSKATLKRKKEKSDKKEKEGKVAKKTLSKDRAVKGDDGNGTMWKSMNLFGSQTNYLLR